MKRTCFLRRLTGGRRSRGHGKYPGIYPKGQCRDRTLPELQKRRKEREKISSRFSNLALHSQSSMTAATILTWVYTRSEEDLLPKKTDRRKKRSGWRWDGEDCTSLERVKRRSRLKEEGLLDSFVLGFSVSWGGTLFIYLWARERWECVSARGKASVIYLSRHDLMYVAEEGVFECWSHWSRSPTSDRFADCRQTQDVEFPCFCCFDTNAEVIDQSRSPTSDRFACCRHTHKTWTFGFFPFWHKCWSHWLKSTTSDRPTCCRHTEKIRTQIWGIKKYRGLVVRLISWTYTSPVIDCSHVWRHFPICQGDLLVTYSASIRG